MRHWPVPAADSAATAAQAKAVNVYPDEMKPASVQLNVSRPGVHAPEFMSDRRLAQLLAPLSDVQVWLCRPCSAGAPARTHHRPPALARPAQEKYPGRWGQGRRAASGGRIRA